MLTLHNIKKFQLILSKFFLFIFETFCQFLGKLLLLKIGRNEHFIMQCRQSECRYEEQTLAIIFFRFMCQKLELMKQIHLIKKGFVIFVKGAMFLDFIDTRLSNNKPTT